MELFACHGCDALLFFENTSCLGCGAVSAAATAAAAAGERRA